MYCVIKKRALVALMMILVFWGGAFANLPQVDCSGALTWTVGGGNGSINGWPSYTVGTVVNHEGKVWRVITGGANFWNSQPHGEPGVGQAWRDYWEEVVCQPIEREPNASDFKFDDMILTFNGADRSDDVEVDADNPAVKTFNVVFFAGDDEKLENGEVNPINAGTYIVAVIPTGIELPLKWEGAPYAIAVGTLEILPFPLTLDLSDDIKAKLSVVFDGEDYFEDFPPVPGRPNFMTIFDEIVAGDLSGMIAEAPFNGFPFGTITIDGFEEEEAINAGTYVGRVSIANENYVLKDGGIAFVITPRPVNVGWAPAGEFIFDGHPKPGNPMVNQADLAPGMQAPALAIAGRRTDIGAFKATASTENTNFTIANAESPEYTITPRPITLVWAVEDLVFSGVPQPAIPTIDPEGLVIAGTTNSVPAPTITVNGRETNAGTGFKATAEVIANFTITNAESPVFSIAKLERPVIWGTTLSFVQAAQPQAPTATIAGVPSGTINLTVRGGATVVGTHTATAELSAAHAINYILTGDLTKEFTITGGTSITNGGANQSKYGIAFRPRSVVKSGEVVEFVVSAPSASQVSVVILDNLGNVINSQELRTGANNEAIGSWDLTNRAGRFVAAGTYIVVVEAKAVNGRVYRYTARLGVSN